MTAMRCMVVVSMLVSMSGVRADASVRQKAAMESMREAVPNVVEKNATPAQQKGSERNKKVVDARKQEIANVSSTRKEKIVYAAKEVGKIILHGVVIPVGLATIEGKLLDKFTVEKNDKIMNCLFMFNALVPPQYLQDTFSSLRLGAKGQVARGMLATLLFYLDKD